MISSRDGNFQRWYSLNGLIWPLRDLVTSYLAITLAPGRMEFIRQSGQKLSKLFVTPKIFN